MGEIIFAERKMGCFMKVKEKEIKERFNEGSFVIRKQVWNNGKFYIQEYIDHEKKKI